MIVKLFDVQDGVLIPTPHCYALKSLKEVMEAFPRNYIKAYLYIFYMTYPDPEENPFFNIPMEDKEDLILKETGVDFSTDHPAITNAINLCSSMYDTPTRRAHDGMKILIDKLAKFFKSTTVSTGRDGSLDSLMRAGEKFQSLRESFKGVEKDYNEELKAVARGDVFTAYDQR